MKHLIIINKHAGNTKGVVDLVERDFKDLNYEIYETVDQRSAISFLQTYFKNNTKEVTRVYACGGDGTLHEVVNGLVGVKNAELAIYPTGTGNDFVKIYGGVKRFLDFKKLIEAKTTDIDLTKFEGDTLKEPWYSINVINFGFDAIVGAKGNENKKKGIKKPYGFAHAIVPAILHGRKNNISVYADGKIINEDGRLLLSSVAQGQFVGGEYHASPKSDNADGKLDVILVKPMTLFKLLAKFFSAYHDGKHVDDEKLKNKVIYNRAEVVDIKAPEDIDICVDGEMIRGKEFKCTVMPKAIKFVLPDPVEEGK